MQVTPDYETVVEKFEDDKSTLIVEDSENDFLCDGSIDSILDLFPEDFLSMEPSIKNDDTESAGP
jgi:hypothetical protein